MGGFGISGGEGGIRDEEGFSGWAVLCSLKHTMEQYGSAQAGHLYLLGAVLQMAQRTAAMLVGFVVLCTMSMSLPCRWEFVVSR